MRPFLGVGYCHAKFYEMGPQKSLTPSSSGECVSELVESASVRHADPTRRLEWADMPINELQTLSFTVERRADQAETTLRLELRERDQILAATTPPVRFEISPQTASDVRWYMEEFLLTQGGHE